MVFDKFLLPIEGTRVSPSVLLCFFSVACPFSIRCDLHSKLAKTTLDLFSLLNG